MGKPNRSDHEHSFPDVGPSVGRPAVASAAVAVGSEPSPRRAVKPFRFASEGRRSKTDTRHPAILIYRERSARTFLRATVPSTIERL
jgi:hypothetical protein